jgi:hypothetical protein
MIRARRVIIGGRTKGKRLSGGPLGSQDASFTNANRFWEALSMGVVTWLSSFSGKQGEKHG